MTIDLRQYHATARDRRDAYVNVYNHILGELCPACIPIEDVRFWTDDPEEMHASLENAVFASFDNSGKCSVGFELVFTDRQRFVPDRRYIIRLAVTFDSQNHAQVQVDGKGDFVNHTTPVIDEVCTIAKRLIDENTKT